MTSLTQCLVEGLVWGSYDWEAGAESVAAVEQVGVVRVSLWHGWHDII